MILLRSYVVLRLARCKTSEITNFISRNISRSSQLALCTPNYALKHEETEKILSKSDLKITTCNDTGYVERITSDDSIKNNAHSIDILNPDTSKLSDALEDIDIKLPGPLDPCDEDLSHIGPNITPTYNFAKFADKSNTLQQLVKLGVELYKLERDRDVVEMFLSLDFDKDIKPYIQFLHDCGVSPENLGYFITRNPKIFKEDMDDLHTRIRYLRAHKFTPEKISLIINKHPPWLSFTTKDIDYRLGHFQSAYKLTGSEIRHLATKCPKLITYDMRRIRVSSFAIKEEMGFNLVETQNILLQAPRVWIRAKSKVLKTFIYANNIMKLSHAIISSQPHILLCRKLRLQQRHEFLVQLQRNQYDPSKPLYVSPMSLITGSDIDFCKNVAHASIDTYNLFLKNY
ncbi:mitochondrial transcription termination factor 3 [Megachile rotundata]|uniref:mitochondrial transcription termination factor 3 n=1 Tax=Megachile rotundata TaxID=143995 RepID=UPI000258F506|nr:PREDICTED: transcription termination factor 3, mitochondrial [Megachile rotundata]